MGKINTKPNGSLLSGGKFALGVVIGVFSAIAIYLAADIFNAGLTRNEVLDAIPSMLTLFIAVVSLVLSYHALTEQQLMRQAGTDPVLVAFFDQREDAAELIVIRIANIGAGAALNVDVAIVSNEVGFDEGVFNKANLGTNPLRTIPQGDSVYFNFGRGFELLKPPLPEPVVVNLSYENIEGKTNRKTFDLDIRQMAQLPSHKSLQARQATAIEDVSNSLKQTSSRLDSILLEVTEMSSGFRQWQKK